MAFVAFDTLEAAQPNPNRPASDSARQVGRANAPLVAAGEGPLPSRTDPVPAPSNPPSPASVPRQRRLLPAALRRTSRPHPPPHLPPHLPNSAAEPAAAAAAAAATGDGRAATRRAAGPVRLTSSPPHGGGLEDPRGEGDARDVPEAQPSRTTRAQVFLRHHPRGAGASRPHFATFGVPPCAAPCSPRAEPRRAAGRC